METGISDDEMIEIISGVEEGDELAKNLTPELTEGSEVVAKHAKPDEEGKDEENDKDEK